MPSACSTSDSFGVQVVKPRYVERSVPAVDEHRDRSPSRPPRQLPANHRGQLWRDETGAVVGENHCVAVAERRAQPAGQSASGGLRQRPTGLSIDPDQLLLGRVHAAGKNPRLDRRPVAAHALDAPSIHAAMEAGQQPPAFRVGADTADKRRASAERRHVVGGVSRSTGHDLRGVVFQNQNRRFSRHA